jgi:hypothetical protein
MHLQQTKVGSRATGGPQYYFHDVPRHVKEFLRRRGACPVVLQTPYGIARSPFTAVGRDHKLSPSGKVIAGKVGHDRIQGEESIGEAIRYWYGLSPGRDFQRISVEVVIHEEHFVLIPTTVLMQGGTREKALEKPLFPLSFHRDFQSKLWKKQLTARRAAAPAEVAWAGKQIRRVVEENRASRKANVHEADLLRTAGALSLLGLELGLYLTKGFDCPESRFQFADLPPYPCPVEIKKRSARFDYQITRYTDLPRAVVLCLDHDLVNPPDHVDVIELSALAAALTVA